MPPTYLLSGACFQRGKTEQSCRWMPLWSRGQTKKAERKPSFTARYRRRIYSMRMGSAKVMLTVASESARMDMRKRRSSFQDTSLSLSCAEVMRGIVSGYGGTLDCEDSPMKIGTPMVQYEETDREFCRRLAGRGREGFRRNLPGRKMKPV